METKTIRRQIEGILGLHIADNSWQDVWEAAESQGKMTGSRTNKILRILCEATERLQDEANQIK
jgi:hypothetical protein